MLSPRESPLVAEPFSQASRRRGEARPGSAPPEAAAKLLPVSAGPASSCLCREVSLRSHTRVAGTRL